MSIKFVFFYNSLIFDYYFMFIYRYIYLCINIVYDIYSYTSYGSRKNKNENKIRKHIKDREYEKEIMNKKIQN